MIQHADQINVSQIFSENFVYSIPKYQRGYSWTTKHWERMFDDLVENEKGYFFGTVICVLNQKINPDKYIEYELIDGQQRFTTLSILLLSIYAHLLRYKDRIKNNDSEYENFVMLKKEFVYKNEVPRVQLQIQENNQEDYYYYLGVNDIIDYAGTPEKIKSRRISKAYRYFYDRIKRYLCDIENLNTSDEVEMLFNLIEKINSSVVVKIQVDSHADAYVLFEALNNAGMPLSGIDLIKNSLIAEASKDNNEDKIYNKWCEIIDNIGNDYGVQVRFFCQFYNAFIEEINKPYRTEKVKYYFGTKATKTNILNVYEKLIKENYGLYLEKLYNASKIYKMFINSENCDIESDIKNMLLRLDRIKGVSAYILLLNLFTYKNQYDLSDENLVNIINYIVNFFVRRNLTDYPNTSILIKIFMDMTNKILDKKSKDIEMCIIKIFKSIFEDRDMNEFKNTLFGKVYELNADVVRFLLCYYEKDHETKEKFTDLWERNGSSYIWTIEHIFPEGEKIPKVWIDMIGDGDIDKAIRIHNKYVHCLGNLTMTGYNSNLSNKSFEDKKNLKDSRGNNIGYNNGLFMNEEIYRKAVWKEEDIIDRTNRLAKYFFEKYDIMGKSWDELNNKLTIDSVNKISNYKDSDFENNLTADDEDKNTDINGNAKKNYILNRINELSNLEFVNSNNNFTFKIYFYHTDKYGVRDADYISFIDKLDIISPNIFDKYLNEMQEKYPDEIIEIRDFNFKVKDLKKLGLIK